MFGSEKVFFTEGFKKCLESATKGQDGIIKLLVKICFIVCGQIPTKIAASVLIFLSGVGC